MKTKVLTLVFTVILLSHLAVAQFSEGEDTSIPPNPIKIDEYWIDVFQSDDAKTLEIEEYFFVNNTGDEPLNDDFYIWIQKNGDIKAECCGGAANMACRLKAGGAMACFNFAKMDENLYLGRPFLDQNILSYYGQKGWLRINIVSFTNLFINNTLHLNVSLGGFSVPRGSGSGLGGGVHITSDNREIGIRPVIDMNMPQNITVTENIRVFNNGTENEVVNLSIDGIPQNWSAELWNSTGQFDMISLLPQEQTNLTLRITAPSYIAPIKVSYSTKMSIEGENKIKGSFKNQYLYDTKRAEYFIFLLSDKGLELSEDLTIVHPSGDGEPILNEEYDRYWYVVQSRDIEANSLSTITVGWEEPKDQLKFFAILAVILIIALLVTVPIMKKKGIIGAKKEVAGGEGTGENHKPAEESTKDEEEEKTLKLAQLEKEKKKLLGALARVKSDESEGYLTPVEAKDIKKHYLAALKENKMQISELNDIRRYDQPSSEGNGRLPEPSEVKGDGKPGPQKRIDNLSVILKKLDDDHNTGLIPGEVYSDLKEKYEKEVSELQKNLTEEEKALTARKEKMLKAIARLEEEREMGLLDDETYKVLKTDYERVIEDIAEHVNREGKSPMRNE
ncbi:MAG: hypothetical protein V3U20_07455 [Thermoplasmata archaeon]